MLREIFFVVVSLLAFKSHVYAHENLKDLTCRSFIDETSKSLFGATGTEHRDLVVSAANSVRDWKKKFEMSRIKFLKANPQLKDLIVKSDLQVSIALVTNYLMDHEAERVEFFKLMTELRDEKEKIESGREYTYEQDTQLCKKDFCISVMPYSIAYKNIKLDFDTNFLPLLIIAPSAFDVRVYAEQMMIQNKSNSESTYKISTYIWESGSISNLLRIWESFGKISSELKSKLREKCGSIYGIYVPLYL